MKDNSKSKSEGILGMLGSPTSIPTEVRKTYDSYNDGKIDRKKFREELERLMWKSKTNAPEYFPGLKKVTDWLKQKDENPNQGRIRLKDEGYGAVYTKDIKKDPKHTTNKYTGKVNRWTVKFCESLDGGAAQTPSDEESIRKLIDKLKNNTAIVFYSLTNPKIGVYIRRTGNGELEITDTAGAEYRLYMPEDESKLDLLTYQLSRLHRKYNTHKTFSTISTRPFMIPPKRIKREELKETIKELIQEMWTGWEQQEGFDKVYADKDDDYTRCSACGDHYEDSGEPGENPHNLCADCRGAFAQDKADAIERDPQDLYEAKGMTNKEKLRNIIREAIEEVEHDYDEETEKQLINSIATISRTSLSKISSLRPEEIQRAFREIDRLAEKLVDMHKEPSESPFAMYREVAPEGWEGTVKAMKKSKDIDNPWALAHWMKGKGYKSRKE